MRQITQRIEHLSSAKRALLESRLPLNRYGQVHVYNNYVTGSTSTSNPDLKFGSGLDARYHSNIINENNYYQFTGLFPGTIYTVTVGTPAGYAPSPTGAGPNNLDSNAQLSAYKHFFG